ncbi:hypothetical protein CRX42_02325 [Pseudomonas jessenii]|uniref:Uncharacterized protein n=1 Tax=Pseudomonas jessenii TaxID=77298 RepID=A0A2W0EWC9_PSEJE|nr:hypothetical protein [Pseudomonas jessenii]PYY72187.1 hypothetical protein CRX42_02325 [Pseudomonas jessenii]
MANQTQRLEIATVKAEIGSDILSRFSNDPVDADPIPTDSGDIQNLKQMAAVIEADGQAAVDAAVAEGIVDLSGSVASADESAARSEIAASVSAASAKQYLTVADGLAATSGTGTTNRLFSVPGVGNDYSVQYRNDAGVAVQLNSAPSSTKVQKIAGPNPATTPQVFESLDDTIPPALLMDPGGKILAVFPDPRIDGLEETSLKSGVFETLDEVTEGEVWIRDADGKIVARLASASIAVVVAALAVEVNQVQNTAVKSDFYETLDPAAQVMFVDEAGKVLGFIQSTAPLTAELASAAGSRTTLTERLASGLTPFGDVLSPYANRWSVRDARMRFERLLAGESVQWVLALLGDSYSNDRSFYSQTLAKRLQSAYGMAGAGWVGFGWYSSPVSGTWTAGSQPVGIAGGVRTDLVPICQIIGTWACAYNSPASNVPALYKVTSSTPDDYVRFSVPAASGAYANSCQLFYSGDGTGVIAVSWDDGATYGANIALATVGADNLTLSGVPAAGCTARIKVVSGSVGLGGVDLKNTAPGVRVHKLGSSGARSVQWAGVGTPWRTQMLALGSNCHQVLLATNDQTDSSSPSSVASNFATVFTNLDAVMPWADKVLVMPAENQRTTTTVKMTQYAKAGREFAVPKDIGFVDLQYVFGSPDNFAFAYAAANPARPWYASDLIHPDGPTGGRIIATTLFNFYTQL